MSNASAVARAQSAPAVIPENGELVTIRPHSLPLTLDQTAMDSMVRLAEIMATGKATVPPEYRNNPGDCLAVVMQAVQWRMNPYAVAQKTYFVSGKIGYEAQLISAVITSLAPIEDRLHYEWYGNWDAILGKFVERESKTQKDKHGNPSKYKTQAWTAKDEEGVGVRVWATIRGEAEPRELRLLMTQAITRNSTLWTEDPRQQLAYLATKRWARLYTPDVIMGVYSPDELNEIRQPAERNMGSAEVVREKLGVAPPALATVLTEIAKASTPYEMEKARIQVAKLASDDEKKQAGNAWKARLAELKSSVKKPEGEKKAEADVVDQETGEVIETAATDISDIGGQSSGAPAINFEALKLKIENEQDLDVLSAHASLIGEIADMGQQNTLAAAFKKRREEIVAQAGKKK